MANPKRLVVFVHGWSVTHTNTYGEMPVRLQAEAAAAGIDTQIKHIFLGRYISFHDEVRVVDIARAFNAAVEDELKPDLKDGTRFVCITHSTGGPVIRDWWHRYYLGAKSPAGVCPMSHLIMLAPANYGSALAQLGKGPLSRMKHWFEGVEPGQGVLDWLELGSAEAWDLNRQWITSSGRQIGPQGVFPFTLTGQAIDRAFYDHINTYTGELGSDGVVRVAAANLGGRYIELVQSDPLPLPEPRKGYQAGTLTVATFAESPPSAMRVVSGKSHSGTKMGIMRSVKATPQDSASQETMTAIIACLRVQTKAQYTSLCKRFANETAQVQQQDLLEIETRFLRKAHFIHDKFAMVIFRVRDKAGYPIKDFDLVLTAGPKGDPNHLPRGFFADRQRNRVNPETITYFFNYHVMTGMDAVVDGRGKVVREALPGAETLGFRITARPTSGFVHYLPCEIKASGELLTKTLGPNSTTLIDIRLHRVVHKNVFRMEKFSANQKPTSFKKTKPGDAIVD